MKLRHLIYMLLHYIIFYNLCKSVRPRLSFDQSDRSQPGWHGSITSTQRLCAVVTDCSTSVFWRPPFPPWESYNRFREFVLKERLPLRGPCINLSDQANELAWLNQDDLNLPQGQRSHYPLNQDHTYRNHFAVVGNLNHLKHDPLVYLKIPNLQLQAEQCSSPVEKWLAGNNHLQPKMAYCNLSRVPYKAELTPLQSFLINRRWNTPDLRWQTIVSAQQTGVVSADAQRAPEICA